MEPRQVDMEKVLTEYKIKLMELTNESMMLKAYNKQLEEELAEKNQRIEDLEEKQA